MQRSTTSRLTIHPLIRLVSFLIFAAFVAVGNLWQLLFAAVLVCMIYAASFSAQLKTAWPLLRRMRWLFLSLLIVYLWFTPGQPLFPALGSTPTIEGIEEGLQRIAALVLLALSASLLLQTTPREPLLAALYRLLTPLGWIGIKTERLAVRIALTLETVTEAQHLLSERMRQEHASSSRNPITRIGDVCAGLFQEVIARAESAPCTTLSITGGDRPPPVQLLLPLALCGAFWFLG